MHRRRAITRPVETAHPASVDDTQRRQRLRLRRLGIAVAVYLSCGALLFSVAWLGLLSSAFVAQWVGVFALANAGFYALIRSGINQRFADASLTMPQMLVSIVAVALVLYQVQAARGALLSFLLVILFFGALQLRTAQLYAVGAFSSASYAVVIALLAAHRPDDVDLRVEWVQWVALTATLIVLCPLVGYFSGMRRRLSTSLRTIREMAHRDALTGVFNRHHLVETLERELARTEREGVPLLVAMVDIDHFKRINDSHGHLAGDEALCAVATTLRDTLREVDYLARYGGEEFVMILAVDGAPGASAVLERVRGAVEKLRVDALGDGRVTVSIGAAFHAPAESATSLLARADAALYRAKQAGRDRVEIDGAVPRALGLCAA